MKRHIESPDDACDATTSDMAISEEVELRNGKLYN